MDLREIGAPSATRHPWELSRARALEGLARAYGPQTNSDILDYGCGDGFAGRRLFERLRSRRYLGFDAHLTKEQCEAWSSSDGRFSFVNQTPPDGQRFDLVLLCDVIEHVEEPVRILQDAFTRVREGGVMVVTVPAFQRLFSDHDRALKHFRRYSLGELVDVLEQARLEVGRTGYLFGSLLVPRLLSVARENLRPAQASDMTIGVGGWTRGPIVTRSLTTLLDIDNHAMLLLAGAGIKLPGLTAWAVLRRRYRQ